MNWRDSPLANTMRGPSFGNGPLRCSRARNSLGVSIPHAQPNGGRGPAAFNTEAIMNTVIDLGSELLVDGSTIRDPYLRLLTAAVGQKLAQGSPWVAVNKRVAA